MPDDDIKAELDRAIDACNVAYWHIDSYGLLPGDPNDDHRIVSQLRALDVLRPFSRPHAAPPPPKVHRVVCPDCGAVDAYVEGYSNGIPVCGTCPRCGDPLYFAK
jgi:hypothetical protein